MRRGDLTAAQWRALKALLAASRGRRGRPPEKTRAVINGILWRLRTGAPWRDVPGRYGDWNTIYRRYRRWRRSGLWGRVAAAIGEPGAGGDGKAGLRAARIDGANAWRGPPGHNARSATAKGRASAQANAAVRPGARAAAGLASAKRPARPATR